MKGKFINIAVLDALVAKNTIVYADELTGKFYGRIRYELKIKGNPIPENDLWIASIAIQHDLVLIIRDKHFNIVVGLKTEAW